MRTVKSSEILQIHAQLPRRLMGWYDAVEHARDMPWRRTRDPYAIWLSETMLQQTQVETVKPYYTRFLERFPTVAALAGAPLEEVLALWAGLGYYRRAKHLHLAARQMVAAHGGALPGTVAELRALPGIGRYTAGAVGSIAFGLSAPVVDGNVMRVLARVFAYERDIAVPAHQVFFWETAERLVSAAPGERYGDFNQAMMELGATVCTPAQPACLLCPLRECCRAFAEGRQGELPMKSKRKESPVLRGTALVIFRTAGKGKSREVLLMQRPVGGIWENMWEFPVIASGNRGALAAFKLQDPVRCGAVKHTLTHRTILLKVIRATCDGKALPEELPECLGDKVRYQNVRWHRWPLAGTKLPMSRLVHKIAELVEPVAPARG